MKFGHHEDKAFGLGFGVGMNCDPAFHFNQRRLVNQGFRLRVDSVSCVSIRNGRDGCRLLRLLGVVELDVSLWIRRTLVCGPLLHGFGRSLPFLLIRGFDNAPAPSPGCAGTKSDTRPVLVPEFCSLHDRLDVIEVLAFSGNQGTGIKFLQGRVLEHGQTNSSRPLRQ